MRELELKFEERNTKVRFWAIEGKGNRKGMERGPKAKAKTKTKTKTKSKDGRWEISF